jgi:ceramide glucosyltransferase
MNVEARVIATRAIGPNRKADQLARALSAEGTSESVVIIADSDVDLRNLSLDALLAPLANPNVAAAWAAPCEPAPHTLADRASSAVLDSSLHSFPLLASIDPHGMVGKLVAIRPHALRSIGGFDGLVNFLGEDMEMARRLRAAGFEVVRANVLAPSLAHGRTWRQVVGRYARWMSVVRGQRTALLLAYPGLFFATLPIASLALAVARFDRVAGLVPMALAVSARLFAALVARSRTGHVDRGTSLVADVVLADGLLLVAFVTALVSRTFEWRGIGLRLGPRGQLEENPRPRTTGPKATV